MSKLILAVVSVISGGVLVASAGAVKIPASPKLPAGWSHAQINIVVKRKAYTLDYDRGRVLTVTGGSLTLDEQDGSAPTIAVSPTARITINGRPALLSQIRPREIAVTVGIDGAPAVSVRVTIPPALAAQLARQAARQARRQGGQG